MATIFSKILAGEIPGRFVWRDDRAAAFLDIEPLTRGHVLVVPVDEVDHWLDLPADLRDHLFAVAQEIGKVQKEVFDSPRVGVVIQGFEVPHCHVHVFPAHKISDFELSNKHAVDDADLDDDARRLREGLRAAGHDTVPED